MLVDFGHKLFDPSMKTTIGARAVTPGFAPPEQYGQGSTDPRTDIYALGATLYNITTNQLPMESIRRMVGGKLKTAHEVNQEIPESLSQIMEQAMALEPSHRFQNALEFKAALRGKLTYPAPAAARQGNRSVSPVREQQAAPVMRPPASVPAPVSYPRDDTPPTRRFAMGMGLGAIALVVLCVIGIVAVGFWLISSQSNSATQTANAEIQQTTEARVRLTSTAQEQDNANLNSTEQARVTAAAREEATATAQAGVLITAQALDGYIQNTLNNRTLVAGPIDGQIPHNAEDTLISVFQEPADLRDFVVEANLFNPYSPTTGNWDYGFLFRHEEQPSFPPNHSFGSELGITE
jgi:serine/threonine protein kinase